MKKIIVLVWILACAVGVKGQQQVDAVMRARAYNSAGNPDLAVKVLTDAITVSGESRLYTERAEAHIAQRSYSDAIADLNEANRITPGSGEYGLSKVYALKNDAATSLYHLGLSMQSPSRKPEKEIMLDQAFGKIDNRPEWRQFWKKEWYSATEKGIAEIEYDIASGQTEDSKAVLADLKGNYGSGDDIVYAEALVNLASGKTDAAIRSASDLVTRNPGNEKYLRLLARGQTESNNPAGASDTYTSLLGAGVADAGLLVLRAQCYMKTGENDKALNDLRTYLDLYPDDKEALSLTGREEAISGDNLKAIDFFSKNLKLHPNDAQCFIDRANAYFVSKSWANAINDYSMSLDLSPSNSDAWLNKGLSLMNTGRVEDACHDFRRALSLGNKRASEYISSHCIK